MVDTEVQTKYSSDRYTSQMQECVFGLLDLNIAMGQIPAVIRTVAELTGKTINDVPSKATINDWNIMRLTLAQKQLGEELPNKSNLGLLSDETSKFGNKYEGLHVSDSSGRMYVLGLRDLVSKSGKDTLSTFQQVLRDIESSCNDQDDEKSKAIITNIVTTMSDRAGTQLKFNDLLEEYSRQILPLTIENYEVFTEQQRMEMGKLCNFLCGLHALVHLAETASRSLVETEKGFFEDNPPIYDKSFTKTTEAGATRLIRTMCKAIAQGADEKSGCHGSFSTHLMPFLKENGFRSLPIVPFRGNRFNILFQNAASVYYLASHLQTFLEGNAQNRLLHAVLHDLKVPAYLAGCKALGLVSFLVTVPLWQVIEDRSINIIDIGQQYQEVIDFLTRASESIEDFITGKLFVSFANQEKNKIRRDFSRPYSIIRRRRQGANYPAGDVTGNGPLAFSNLCWPLAWW